MNFYSLRRVGWLNIKPNWIKVVPMNNYRIDAKSIKEQARGRWLDILPLLDARLADAVQRVGKHVPCPSHGGKDGFRVYANDENGGGACNTCGTFRDGFEILQWLRGCSFLRIAQAG